MNGGRDPGRKGGSHDDVARNIRNEQNHDARPTEEEVKRQAKKDEVVHAQWKAVQALINRIDGIGASTEPVKILAKLLDFVELEREAQRFGGIDRNFKKLHIEAHEIPDPSDNPRYQGTAMVGPPFDATHNMDRVRRLKQEAFSKIQLLDPDDFAVARRRLNPFGASLALAIIYDDDVYTNETWDKTFRDDAWSDSFDEDTIDEYRTDLDERLSEAQRKTCA